MILTQTLSADDSKSKIDMSKVEVTSSFPSGFGATESPKQLIDGDKSTKLYRYLENAKDGESITFTFPKKVNLKGYSITSGNDCPERDPKTWEFYGSNKQGVWVLLDKQTNVTFSNRKETKDFELKKTAHYKSYKLLIKEVGVNSSGLQFAEIEFWNKIVF